MEWTTPASGPAEYAYSYDAAEAPAELPALWRCGCGFQVDSLSDAAAPARAIA